MNAGTFLLFSACIENGLREGARPDAESAPEVLLAPPEASIDVVRMPHGMPDSDALLYEEGVIHDIYLTLDDGARSDLEHEPRVDVHAGFRWGQDTRVYEVGLRLKGTASFRPLSLKSAFKVDFHEWDPEGRFHGVKRLTLNNMVQDATMMHEHLYYWLCQKLGIPAPRHGYARVWVNEVDYGLHGIVETFDEQLIDRLWPYDDKGTLYEASGDLTQQGRDGFEVKESGLGPALDDLITTIDATPPDGFLAMLEANFDLEALLGYLALDIVGGNPDGYAQNHHNYYLYSAPLTWKWTLLPAGTDRSFSLLDRGLAGRLAIGCAEDDRCRALLDERIRKTADAWDELGVEAVAREMLEVVGPACEADPRRERLCRSPEILDFIVGRTDAVRKGL